MTSSVFNSKANPQQYKAIITTEGPLLIIAGPGSGKTFTLVERIVHLISKEGAEPESLFIATFTDKAAKELVTRISTRLNEIGFRFNLNEMYIGTFHSICLRWLDEYREYTRLKRNYIMMDRFDQQYFLYQRLKEYNDISGVEKIIGHPRDVSSWRRSESLMKWLNTVSEEALDVEMLNEAPDEIVRTLGECYGVYQSQIDEANALDFSTIQFEALKLLNEHPDVLIDLQNKITHFMVDEYQDTNTIQESILILLCGNENPNLCVVGDDDQGLYRFRGATIRNILQFKDKFPNGICKQINLTTNYRSHPDIIRFFGHWIEDQEWTSNGQVFRFSKSIEPDPDTDFPAVPIAIQVSGSTQEKYHQEVLAFLLALREKGHLKDWNQVAFLFRSVKNPKATALSQFLEGNGVAVYSPRSNQFFEREEIRLMIGALIFLFPQFPEARMWSADAELGIWEYYDKECFTVFANNLRKPEHQDLLEWARSYAKSHQNLVQPADYAFSGLFYQLLRFPLFSRYLDEEALKGSFLDTRAMRNLAIFSQLLSKFEYLHHISVLSPDFLTQNIRDLFNNFFRFLKDGGIFEYEDEVEYAPSGCVSFLTIHQSKGLEFPVVIVDSLSTVPRKQFSYLDELLETGGYLSRPPFEPLELTKHYDFRRLFYTAFSRAQNLLVLTGHEKRQGFWQTPSKYFAEHYDSLISWRDPRFRPEDIPLATIREANIRYEYSFSSHLTVYENCGEQYRFFKELEFAPVRTSPILFGTLVHQTIEDIHKAVLRGEESRLSEDQVSSWFDTNYAYLTKRERVYLAPVIKSVALGQVLRYYLRYEGDWSHIREAEVDVSLVKDDYILSGKVDLIQGKNNSVEVVDFKSEKKLDVNDPKDREKLDRYRRQLEVYAHIVEERTGHAVSKTHLYYTSEDSGNPFITFPKDERSIDHTIQSFDDVVHRIESMDFQITERPVKICRECDIRYYCDAKNWTFRSSE